jgi:hypothetical protein
MTLVSLNDQKQRDEESGDKENEAVSSKAEDRKEEANAPSSSTDFVRDGVKNEICKQVIRCKLAKRRHLVLREAIDPAYLDSLFPDLLKVFVPQPVEYNGGVAGVKKWKISCYLEVMQGGIPTTEPSLDLLRLLRPLLDACNDLFVHWYRQQHSCNDSSQRTEVRACRRLMTFVTRYTPAPGEQALLKVGCSYQLSSSRWPLTIPYHTSLFVNMASSFLYFVFHVSFV